MIVIDFESEDFFPGLCEAEKKLKEYKTQLNITDSDISKIQGRKGWEYRLRISWNRNIS